MIIKSFTNHDIPFISNQSIVEWDIKSANTSLMEYYNLAPIEEIERLRELSKEKRQVAVGMMSRNSKEFNKALEQSFKDMMGLFIDRNNIPEEKIISIKKDAIFLFNTIPTITTFKNLSFVKKNEYHSMLLIPNYEFYISDDRIDVKGISDDKLDLHIDGVLDFIKNVIDNANNHAILNEYLHEYCKAYKALELPLDAYREFKTGSFRMQIEGEVILLESIDESMLKEIDIHWNYQHIILPIIGKVL